MSLVRTPMIAIDPGPTHSAWVEFSDRPVSWGYGENFELESILYDRLAARSYWLAIEDVRSYGQRVGRDTFRTVFFSGRFAKMVGDRYGLIGHTDASLLLCGRVGQPDSAVKLAIYDLYGGELLAVGGKVCSACRGSQFVGKSRCPRCLQSSRAARCDYCNNGTNKSVYSKQSCEFCKDGYSHAPGPFYEISRLPSGQTGHVLSAVAVAIYFREYEEEFVNATGLISYAGMRRTGFSPPPNTLAGAYSEID